MAEIHDLIVIGGGPAGYTAALYAARADLRPLVIEGFQWGGQLMQTTEIDNFPGYPQGVQGPAMMADLRAQAERFGAEFITDDVSRVDFSRQEDATGKSGAERLQAQLNSPLKVCIGEEEYLARSMIVATGAQARELGLASEQRLSGRGVSYCATCDGAFFRDREIVVVGGGDSAMEEATFLSRFGTSVTVVHRRNEFRASKTMLRRAEQDPKVRLLTPYEVEEVVSAGEGMQERVASLKLKHTETGETLEIPCEGLFVAIGHTPNTALFAGQLELDDHGYLLTAAQSWTMQTLQQNYHQPRPTETSVPGVFAAGDVADTLYRQAITAAGSGCQAALDAERYLSASRR